MCIFPLLFPFYPPFILLSLSLPPRLFKKYTSLQEVSSYLMYTQRTPEPNSSSQLLCMSHLGAYTYAHVSSVFSPIKIRLIRTRLRKSRIELLGDLSNLNLTLGFFRIRIKREIRIGREIISDQTREMENVITWKADDGVWFCL